MNYRGLRHNASLNLPNSNVTTHEVNFPLRNSEQLSLKNEPDMKYEETQHYLNIFSGSRDTTNYPNQYDYSIQLDNTYDNVCSVEMISVIFPNSTAITAEPYLVFDVEELNIIDFSLNSGNHKGFAVCPLKNPNQASGGYVLADFGCMYHTKSVFKTPKKLSKLSIKIRDAYGELFTFDGASTDKADQHSFVLKIVTKDVSRASLNHRNVY